MENMNDKKVLVVDDEHDVVAFLEAILKEQGFSVISANDGEACLKRARFDSPDLVILDVEIPKINGFDVFKMLRDDERTEHIPVIMLTGIEEKLGIGFSKEDMKELYHEEPQAYLEKPIEPDIVISAVKRILQV
jgi:CheY-like chemotaxis protein